MTVDYIPQLSELISICIISIFMAISPGADFVMVTRNSLSYGRSAGLFSALGVSLAIWIHVIYSIAGLAILISQSILLFSIIKYLGAAYLIYIGWTMFRSKDKETMNIQTPKCKAISNFQALKIGFITNALNPKTTIFFLSIFTQIVNSQTPLWVQIVYGAIISLAHLAWFCFVTLFFTQPIFLKKFNTYRNAIEKVVGSILIGFGLKVASISRD